MANLKPLKIVYLFGAGATQAELTNLNPTLIEEKEGLLIKDVSQRVIEKARRNKDFLKGIKMVSSASGSLNIELLITLLEKSKVTHWQTKTSRLKGLVRGDIESILKRFKKRDFYLHKALLELHEHPKAKAKEELIGLISLNYDGILDQAYKNFHGEPNYCFCLRKDSTSSKVPLLKLHGSFNWSGKKIRGRSRELEIIPLGTDKNYLYAPYNFIWNRAFEVLIECDILRVIGCSLSQNDIHLIDLLFKSHLEKGKEFEIQIISSDEKGEEIQNNYGFFPKIKRLTEIEPPLVPEENPANAFKTWLKSKSAAVLKKDVMRTTYLKKVSA